jgi:hypothetical protein
MIPPLSPSVSRKPGENPFTVEGELVPASPDYVDITKSSPGTGHYPVKGAVPGQELILVKKELKIRTGDRGVTRLKFGDWKERRLFAKQPGNGDYPVRKKLRQRFTPLRVMIPPSPPLCSENREKIHLPWRGN